MSLEVKLSDFEEYLSENDIRIFKQTIENFTTSKEATEWNGVVFPPGFSGEAAKYCFDNLSLKQGDVLISTHPKNGTFWMGEIVQQIIYQNKEGDEFALNFPHLLTFLEVAPSARFPLLDKLPMKRKIAISHMSAEQINVEKYTKANAKIIYLLRDPKDQTVSLYNFLKKVPPGQVDPLLSMVNSGWDIFFKHVIQGELPLYMKPGNWYPDHVLSWYKHKDNKNVHFVYYEDLIQDPKGQVLLIAKFLDAPITDERAEEITEATSFNNMKSNKIKGEDFLSWFFATNMCKGGVGGWKDYFTVSQSEQIDAIMEERLKNTDIKFTYAL